MTILRPMHRAALALLVCLLPFTVAAEVTVEGTRTIYPANAEVVGVTLKNPGADAALVQVWVSDGDVAQSPSASKAPFVLDRPIVRLEPQQTQVLRVRRVAAAAPADGREHLYWLNVQEVPQKARPEEGNQLQVAVRLRLKLFYRPEGVPAPRDADAQVRMQATPDGLQLHNAALHYFNVGEVTLVSGSREQVVDSFYLAPQADQHVAFPAGFRGPLTSVRYAWIDDDGVLHREVRTF